jgi:hypothetical protein
MQATPALIELLEAQARVAPVMLERVPDEEVIILKDRAERDGTSRKKHEPRISYDDTPDTCMMRMQLEVMNEFIARHVIDLPIPDAAMTTLARELGGKPDLSAVDFTHTNCVGCSITGPLNKAAAFTAVGGKTFASITGSTSRSMTRQP